MGFEDIFHARKALENQSALLALPSILLNLDTMAEDDRLVDIVDSMLAGNMFDWGYCHLIQGKFYSRDGQKR